MHLKEVWDGARDFVARNLIWILALNIVQVGKKIERRGRVTHFRLARTIIGKSELKFGQ